MKTGLTTPDIVTFLTNMAGLERMGITHVAYEASSHGLDQYRAEGVPLAAAAFTNFSRDHLDYHADDGRLFRGQDAAVRRAVVEPARHGGGLDRRSQVGRGDRARAARAGSSC